MSDSRLLTSGTNMLSDFLDEPYASMDEGDLLQYFRTRKNVKFFPLSSGKQAHVDSANQVLHNCFCFNNEWHRFHGGVDWKLNPYGDKEWLILLHKFYYVRDLGLAYQVTGDDAYVAKWIELIASWINDVKEELIDSQVTGRRLQQWILSYHYFIPDQHLLGIDYGFLVSLLKSINDQSEWLRHNLTEAGNHRTIELYALFLVAVVFPELKLAKSLLQFARREILNNLKTDFHPDGVHRELSTDYHHTVLKNFINIRRIAKLNSVPLPEEFDLKMSRAIEFSLHAHKPDGFIPAISDGDVNCYIGLLKKAYSLYGGESLKYVVSSGENGVPPKCRTKGFEKSGYYILRSDWEYKPFGNAYYMFFDCADIGPGSHGHYDLLNFEVAANGRSLIVDPGRFTYSEKSNDSINWRKIFKGTAYHNTVVVDGKDQIRYARGANAHKQPKPVVRRFITTEGFDFISGQAISNEYPVVHERNVFFLLSEYWLVIDVMKAKAHHNYDLFFHLHPEAYEKSTIVVDDQTIRVEAPGLVIAQPRRDYIQGVLEEGFVSPAYGVKHRAPVVKFSQSLSGTTLFHSLILPCHPSDQCLSFTSLPVYAKDGLISSTKATALKIFLTKDGVKFCDYFFLSHSAEKAEFSFESVLFDGALLWLRCDEHDEVVGLQADQIARLSYKGKRLVSMLGGRGCLSTKGRIIYAQTAAENFKVFVPGVTQIVHINPSDADKRPM